MLAGAAAAAVGAVVWALAAYATGYQFEFLALLIGAATGLAVRRAGGAADGRLQVTGALLAVAGCAAGTFLAMVLVLNARYGVSLAVIVAHLGLVLRAYPGVVGWLGLLFWVVAAAAAARIPARRRVRASVPQPARAWSAGPAEPGGYGLPAGQVPTVPSMVWPGSVPPPPGLPTSDRRFGPDGTRLG